MRTYSLSPSKAVQYTVTNLAAKTCYIHVHVYLCASSEELLLRERQAAHPTMSIGWHTLTYWWLQLAFPSLQHVKWLRNKARVSGIHPQEKDILIAECLNMRLIPYSGKLSREKTFVNFTVLWLYVKLFCAKFEGCGILWCSKSEQSTKVFSAKSYCSPIHKSFLPRKFPAIR